MSLLSTVLTFALVPLVKRNEKEGKERIATLEDELAAYKERNKALADALLQSEARVAPLRLALHEERQRGVLDRQQTRYWRSQADYWQSAYTQLAVPNQHGYERQLQRYEQFSQQAQQLQQQQQGQQSLQQYSQAAQQFLGGQGFAQQNYRSVSWLDCTCVPGRAEALMRAEPNEAVRVDSSETIREQARRLMAAPFRSAIGA